MFLQLRGERKNQEMKRIYLTLVLSLILLTVNFAQSIDKPAATVRLTKLQVITVKQFEKQVQNYENKAKRPLSKAEKKKLLDTMIGELLIQQEAEKENITVTEDEVQARINLAKQTGGIGLQLNRPLTDAELKTLVQQTGLSWESYKKEIAKVILEQKYIMEKKKSLFQSIKEPSESEIRDFYDENKTAFVAPEMVRFKHIFIDTRNLKTSEEKKKAFERAKEIYNELKNGASFDDLVVKYSDDRASRYSGGDFGYLRRDDVARKQLLGKNFFETPFKMKVGQISGVLRSNIGYHIIKVVEKIPFKVLSLNDKIPPQNKVTVHDQIKSTLYQRKQAEVFQQAMFEVMKELRKKAVVKIFDKNIPW